MLTPFGLFARHMRLDRSEFLKDMAEKLGVSSAFLSAVETGKKAVPTNWEISLDVAYQLNDGQRNELRKAIESSQKSVRLEVSKLSEEHRSTAFALARTFEQLTPGQIERIQQALRSE